MTDYPFAHPDPPTWDEAAQDAIDAYRNDAANARRSGDHDLATYWNGRADELETDVVRRRAS